MGKAAVAESAVIEGTEEALNSKEQIYVKIRDFIEGKTGKRFGVTASQDLFNLVTENVFASAAKDGSFRFNSGLGALHVRKYQAGQRKTPRGQVVKFGERLKIRYEEGVMTSRLVESGGDLVKVFGDRTKEAPAATAPKAEKKASKPAKASKEKEAEVELE